jgi:predicted transcriptional regulator
MGRKKAAGPTEMELQILSVLWARGPSTVRAVNTLMNEDQRTGYTTTLKLMQIMHEKGLLTRDATSKTHVYSPANPEAHVQEQVVNSLLERVFAGSTEKLVMRALSSSTVSAEELSRIKKLIKDKEQESRR